MRKEILIKKKMEIVEKFPWYLRKQFNDEVVRSYSIRQLENLRELMNEAEKIRESNSPFLILSETEVVRKSTGQIVEFMRDEIRESNKEEVLSGASSVIYKKYLESK